MRLRVLWWNVDWQSRWTADQISAVRSLRPAPDVVALCELQRELFAA